MDIPSGFYRVSVKALILDEHNKFMLIREADNNWEFPGGAIEFEENFRECIIRELKEEMDLEVSEIGDVPVLVTKFQNLKNIWAINIYYRVKVKDLNFKVTDECQEIGFFDKETASKLQLLPSVKAYIKA